jgi:hypothetical protein
MDIIQYNNPTFSHYSSALMCSMPPVYRISYDYDEEGLPVREYRRTEYSEEVQVFDYTYRTWNRQNII